MKMPRVLSVVFLVIVASSAVTEGAVLYTFRNGIGTTDHVDVGVGSDTDLWWANHFAVEPGGNVLTSINVAFGQGWTVGTPVSLLVYDDPNDDGLPNDLVLLTQVDSTIQTVNASSGTTFLDEFVIPPTPVSGDFFVAALVKNAPDTGQIRSEITSPLGRSWIAFNETNLDTFDPSDPNGAEQPPVLIESLIPNQATPLIDWVIEVEAVPEPASLVLAGLAAYGIGVVTRRRLA